MTDQTLVTTYLEMTSPNTFQPAYSNTPNVDVVKNVDKQPMPARYL